MRYRNAYKEAIEYLLLAVTALTLCATLAGGFLWAAVRVDSILRTASQPASAQESAAAGPTIFH